MSAPVPPHQDPALPAQLREALAVMAERGPVVELTVGADGTPAPVGPGTPEQEAGR
ncbi:hypothetical protein [Kitasatospora purpeofusca]|uniref:hypothetical protein n=1 Tax=Kitasatospora purpeofusca TaxID=67352 RepID=UPI003829991F